MRIVLVSIFTALIYSFLFFSFDNKKSISTEGKTIKERYLTPSGYERTIEAKNSFAEYLRNLPLKPSESLVKYYNGSTKSNNNVYDAVVDLPIGNKDLHQCADAVMRLRADYFFQQKQYDKIHFNFTNGFRVDYSKWRQGYRIAIKGNKTSWMKIAKPTDSQQEYWKYLEIIFNYAGTASLAKEMNPTAVSDIQIGDVFIKGGFPGHAVIVVDMATNGNKKIFLLAQSYMPAQELQILLNPSISSNRKVCWYSANNLPTLETPEWTFKSSELKRF
ncbi:DUF4846 domain-containing protein [Flavobacterium sp.]|uniref:DUF4846 domain-containing protein n=1 Tax=Flavobacterium sp. TaxID=239 RepID=UPI00286E559C|nr:DUF4846 domain-containing protein [Flavobacterium sp.]